MTINLEASPAERGLEERKGINGARIWFFPADYEQRVAESMKKLNEKNLLLRNQ